MTKAEIFKRIEDGAKVQTEVIKVVNELFKSVSLSADTAVLAAILHSINSSICDTMNNLALILCEMLPEEEDYNA